MSATAALDGNVTVPSWWDDPRFCLTDIAKFTGVPVATISLWLTLVRATGVTVGDMTKARPLYSARQLFALALLERLHRNRVRVNAKIAAAAFAFADSYTVSVPADEIWCVYDEHGVALNVQAWPAFVAVQHLGWQPRHA